ncbi:MAG: FoF1 ATP synthase subunit gamma [Oscillospiraceae bacterium]
MRAIRTHIKSVESTRQITKSMKMVAACELRRTRDSVGGAPPLCGDEPQDARACRGNRLRSGMPAACAPTRARICYVPSSETADSAACTTAPSSSILELAKGKDCFLVVSGRWGREVIAASGIPVKKTFDAASDTPDSAEARELAGYLRELYLGSRQADKVVLVYEHYKSAFAQVPVNLQLLPVVAGEADETAGDYIFEPDAEELLDRLAQLYLDSTMLSVLLEAKTGERTSPHDRHDLRHRQYRRAARRAAPAAQPRASRRSRRRYPR